MKVIKHGTKYIRYEKCDCGCEFEYDRKDIQAYKKLQEFTGSGVWLSEIKVKKYQSNDESINFYVTCPECGERILVEREID